MLVTLMYNIIMRFSVIPLVKQTMTFDRKLIFYNKVKGNESCEKRNEPPQVVPESILRSW